MRERAFPHLSCPLLPGWDGDRHIILVCGFASSWLLVDLTIFSWHGRAFLILYTIYLYASTIFLLWDSSFFLIGLYMLAYILNSYPSSSKYIEIFFQFVLVFHSCFWCLITSLSWSFIAFEFCVMLREPPGWKKHFSLYSSSIYVLFHLWLFNLCGIYFCAWWEWLV